MSYVAGHPAGVMNALCLVRPGTLERLCRVYLLVLVYNVPMTVDLHSGTVRYFYQPVGLLSNVVTTRHAVEGNSAIRSSSLWYWVPSITKVSMCQICNGALG
ncbi:hypothetical protein EVAR_83125_1 [Eumeta japonica]|uniref:Uncharacterized protein n=1 Tax=Eumeta variegata TaxID=151549 RepID=A0A4C1YE50_EUMVA|nr:hypothetical protein EVAR_83125_1 [Eumeta japonica]